MARVWWYAVNGSEGPRRGPVTEDELNQRLKDGRISMTTPVWREGFPAWRPLNAVEELSTLRWANLETRERPDAARAAVLLGPLRAAMVAAGLGLIGALVLWDTLGGGEARKEQANLRWTNPRTQATVMLPPGWVVEADDGRGTPGVHVFTRRAQPCTAELEGETGSQDEQHDVDAWIEAHRQALEVDDDAGPARQRLADRDVLVYEGRRPGGRGAAVRGYFVRRGDRQDWRLLMACPQAADLDAAELIRLRDAVLATL